MLGRGGEAGKELERSNSNSDSGYGTGVAFAVLFLEGGWGSHARVIPPVLLRPEAFVVV